MIITLIYLDLFKQHDNQHLSFTQIAIILGLLLLLWYFKDI
jgi:hypothetical protein